MSYEYHSSGAIRCLLFCALFLAAMQVRASTDVWGPALSASAVVAEPTSSDPLLSFLQLPDDRGHEIIINLPSFRLFLYEDGELLHSYPIAAGKEISPSLLGATRIINKVVDPTYYPPDWGRKGLEPVPPGPNNPVGTRWLGLALKGYGIHGTNEPSSIGRAASAGCVRMHNRDVEDLAELVSVGTPVSLVYETILVWRNPVTDWPMVQVFPDIYSHGAKTLDEALELLESFGVEDVHEGALGTILAAAESQPEPVPLVTDIQVVECGMVSGYRTFDEVYVCLDELAALVCKPQALETIPARSTSSVTAYEQEIHGASTYAGQTYVPLAAAARAFGLLVGADGESLAPVVLRSSDETLQLRAFLADEGLLIPVEPLASALGVSVGWDASLRAPRVGGQPVTDTRLLGNRAYASHTSLASALGVRIHWQPGSSVALLRRPVVALGDRRSVGMWYEDELWLPIRVLAESMGLVPVWDPTKRGVSIGESFVPGLLQDGRLYVTKAKFLSLFPEVTGLWYESSGVLELHLAGIANAPLIVDPGRRGLRNARDDLADSS